MRHYVLLRPLTLGLVVFLAALPACGEREEPPLPEITGVTVALGPEPVNTVILSWQPSTDARVQGYAVYRAEQGLGTAVTEKSEFTLQAVSVATSYVDDEVRSSVRYPQTLYFYQVTAIGPQSVQGPMSTEVSIQFPGIK